VVIAIGVVAGVCGGLLGTGGSIVMIPAITEALGPNQHLYQATAMCMNFCVVVPAVLHHQKVGAVHWSVIKRCAPLAGVAVLVGVCLSEQGMFSGRAEPNLRMLFGFFLIMNAVLEIWRACVRDKRINDRFFLGEKSSPITVSWMRAVGVAVPMGLMAGILGVGGGVLAVPLQRRLLGIGIRSAIANSAALIVTTSAIGATYKNYSFQQYHGDWSEPATLAVMLIPGAILGSMVGSRLTHQLPKRWIKAAFLVLLLVAGSRMMLQALRDMS